MIFAKKIDDKQSFTDKQALPYIETARILYSAKLEQALKSLLLCKSYVETQKTINVTLKCNLAELNTYPNELMTEQFSSIECLDDFLCDAIFQLLDIDESTPNKYNKIASLIEEVTHDTVNKTFDKIKRLYLLSGDIPEPEE